MTFKRRYVYTKEFAGRHGLPSASSLTKARTGQKRLDVPKHINVSDARRVVYDRHELRAWLVRHGLDPDPVDDL